MPLLKSAGEFELFLPTQLRRLVLLIVVVLLSGLVAYAFPLMVGWANAALVILPLALLAGISALWSP